MMKDQNFKNFIKLKERSQDLKNLKEGFTIAYVGNFLNHGNSLEKYGTTLVYLISNLDYISKLDVICPLKNNNEKDLNLKKVIIMESYDYKKPLTMLRIIKLLYSSKYSLIIFNMNSTSFGESSISNFFGIISPLILKRIFKKNILVIYHSSVLTNDVEKLGYNSFYDKLRKSVLKYLETSIFKHIQTFVTLQIYKDMIDKKIKNNKVKAIKLRYIDAIPTILLNQLENKNIKVFRNDKIDIPIILLFGYWGPQKDLEFALNTLNEIKKDGFEFYLKLSGEINNHFKDYRKRYYELIEKYKGIIRELKGYVEEREILNLFTSVDLLLLTYNTPGGFSGVLDLAITFDLPVICIDFPEYREQAKGHTNVILVGREDFKDAVKDFIVKFKPVQSKTINVKEKIEEGIKNVNEIIKHTIEYV